MTLRLESLESAVHTSQGHQEDVPGDSAGYCCDGRLLRHHRRDCPDTRRLRTENKVRNRPSQNAALQD